MKRKLFAIALLLCLALSACSAGKAAPEEAKRETAAPQEPAKTAAPVVDEETGKIKLTLAGMRMEGSGLQELAEAFNAQSDTYIVELRDYYTGDETSDLEDLSQLRNDMLDAKTRLHTELIAGKLPDMLAFDSISPLPYIGKDLLLDLDPYLEADGELTKDELLCWEALHEYGGLFVLGRNFYVDTLSCTQEFYREHNGWTIADYLEIEQNLRGDQQMIYTMSPEAFLTQLAGRYLAKGLDFQNASCDFDNGEFIDILNAARSVGAYALSEDVEAPAPLRMVKGKLICCADWLDMPSKIAIDRNDAGERLSYIGWPTTDGSNGAVVNLGGTISAFVSTPCPEGCWAFIKFAVMENPNAVFAGFGSPIYLPRLREEVDEWNNDPLLAPEVKVTEEDWDAYLDAVNAAQVLGFLDESVMQIIDEESAPVRTGEASAEEAAKRIQARVSLYMTEQYG